MNSLPPPELLEAQDAAQIEKHFILNETEPLDVLMETDSDLDTDEFSFDFPPLEEDFAQASKGQPTPIQPTVQSQVTKSKPIIPKI